MICVQFLHQANQLIVFVCLLCYKIWDKLAFVPSCWWLFFCLLSLQKKSEKTCFKLYLKIFFKHLPLFHGDALPIVAGELSLRTGCELHLFHLAHVQWSESNNDCHIYTIGADHDVRLVTRDCPTPVWHLSSRTPEKSTLWTPWFFYKLNRKVVDNLRIEQKGSAIFFTRLYKPRNRDVWGDTLMAMLLESFLSYHT